MLEQWAEQYLNPETDKCWFCQGAGCTEFDMEFDTFIHIDCLKAALKKDPTNVEARLMAEILKDIEDPDWPEIQKLLEDTEEETRKQFDDIRGSDESPCTCTNYCEGDHKQPEGYKCRESGPSE